MDHVNELKEKCATAKTARLAARRRLADLESELEAAIDAVDGNEILRLKKELPLAQIKFAETAKNHDAALREFIAARNPALEQTLELATAAVNEAKKTRVVIDDQVRQMITTADAEIIHAEEAHRQAAAEYRGALDEDLAEQSAIWKDIAQADARLRAA